MKRVKYVFASVLMCAILVGCGGKEEKKKEGFSYENKKSTQKTVEKDDINEVILTSNDLMQFNKTEIRVKAGKKS